MERKLISVIIPAYNAEKYLAEALDSIVSQDYQPHEVIVVDDGSTDNTAAIVKSYPEARYVYQSNRGLAAAKNTGLTHATGGLISFLDSDDIWLPSKSRREVEYLEAHPEKGCVLARVQNFLQEGVDRPRWLASEMLGEDFNAYLLGTLLAHRWVFEKVGNFNAEYYWHDTDWFVRVTDARIPTGTISEPLLRRRIHENNMTGKLKDPVHDRLLILKQSIDRKRANAAQSLSS
jgi:glycosyltransferase involved in cell wall biosynthesis